MGYHITKKENLFGREGIAEKGIVPMHGERSDMVGDDRTTICFTTDIYDLPFWKKQLYPDTPVEDLCVLSFPYDKNDCMKGYKEYSIDNIVDINDIYIVTFYDRDTLLNVSFEELEKPISCHYNQSKYFKIGIQFSSLMEYKKSFEESYQYVKKR